MLSANLAGKASAVDVSNLQAAFNARYNTTLVNDANAAVTSGFYRYYANSANTPWLEGGTIFAFLYDGITIVQVSFFNGTATKFALRIRVNYAWTAWRII